MRYRNLDLMKALAMLMVVSLHAGTWHANSLGDGGIAGYVQYAFRIASEGVPIFVAVNGFLMLGKDGFNLKKHLRKTLNIFALLIAWLFILTISKSLIHGDSLSLASVLSHCFPASIISDGYTGVLWFLQSLVALYLFVPLLKLAYDRGGNLFDYIFWSSFGVWSLAAIVGYAIYPFEGAGKLWDFLSGFSAWVRGFLPAGSTAFVLYFMAGGMAKKHLKWIEGHSGILCLSGCCAWVIALTYAIGVSQITGKAYSLSFNCTSPFIFAMMLGLFSVTLGFKGQPAIIGRMVESVGKSTMGIYLFHTIPIAITYGVFGIASLGFPLRVLYLLGVFIVSWVVSVVGMKIPGVRWLFGK